MATKGGVSRPRVGYREQGLGYFYQGRGMTTKGQLGIGMATKGSLGRGMAACGGIWQPGNAYEDRGWVGEGYCNKNATH